MGRGDREEGRWDRAVGVWRWEEGTRGGDGIERCSPLRLGLERVAGP